MVLEIKSLFQSYQPQEGEDALENGAECGLCLLMFSQLFMSSKLLNATSILCHSSKLRACFKCLIQGMCGVSEECTDEVVTDLD